MELHLLGIIVLGLGGGILGLFGVMRGAWLRSRAFHLAFVTIAGAAAALAAWSSEPVNVVLPLGLLGFWALVCFSESVLAWLSRVGVFMRRPTVAAGLLFVLCPLLAVLWSFRTDADPDYWEATPSLIEQVGSIAKRPALDVKVRTDTGRILPVALPARAATPDEVEQLRVLSVLSNVICTDAPGADYNCHGWVFTGGKFWINGSQVREILDDNGYRPVSVPSAGDVIVYLKNGEVAHTGIVRAANMGQVLVESKWGMQGRFIHAAENQEYSQDFGYYRSQRQGHLLQGLNDDGAGRHQAVRSELNSY